MKVPKLKLNKLSYFSIILILFISFSCKTTQGKGGRQQPKNGPIPCPIKDC